MGHRAAARSLLAIAAKLQLERRRTHTKGPVFSNWLGQSEKCSDKYVVAWSVDYESPHAKLSSRKKKKYSTYRGPKFKVEKSTSPGQDRLQEVQEVFKTCSGVGFGQPECEHRGSKSGQWLGQISP